MIGYGSVAALIFSVYTIYDIKVKIDDSLSPQACLSHKEYVFAAKRLSLDRMRLFYSSY